VENVPVEFSRASNPASSLSFRLFAAVAGLTGVGIVVAGLFGGSNGGSDFAPEAVAMVEVAPGGVIDPQDVPEPVAVLYRAAHEHADLYAQVPCFCGCEAMLGHRHLLDCFARPEGGWEAHGLGCGVCLGEAQQVQDLLAAGVQSPNEIRAAVVTEWGDPYQ
jgi:hypothetical protein